MMETRIDKYGRTITKTDAGDRDRYATDGDGIVVLTDKSWAWERALRYFAGFAPADWVPVEVTEG